MVALPYNNSLKSKKVQVEQMFDNISHRYDFLNHLLSLNIDRIWRRRAIDKLKRFEPKKILDVATGTGDFAMAAAKIKGATITGVDISAGMLKVGRAKIEKKGLTHRIEMIQADSESLPFKNEKYDAALAGFGVRNFEHLKTGLEEVLRVLKPGGLFYILEFSKPQNAPFRQIYYFYFTKILPVIGRIVSKDESAYNYLPESVKEFPEGIQFLTILAEVGFEDNKCFPQTFGIASLYEAHKPQS